jgi:hypothetical protein
MVRLHYDADRQTGDALADRPTRDGYTATHDRPDAGAASDTVARLLFGGFFTMMVWYIVFLDPVCAGGSGSVPPWMVGLRATLSATCGCPRPSCSALPAGPSSGARG